MAPFHLIVPVDRQRESERDNMHNSRALKLYAAVIDIMPVCYKSKCPLWEGSECPFFLIFWHVTAGKCRGVTNNINNSCMWLRYASLRVRMLSMIIHCQWLTGIRQCNNGINVISFTRASPATMSQNVCWEKKNRSLCNATSSFIYLLYRCIFLVCVDKWPNLDTKDKKHFQLSVTSKVNIRFGLSVGSEYRFLSRHTILHWHATIIKVETHHRSGGNTNYFTSSGHDRLQCSKDMCLEYRSCSDVKQKLTLATFYDKITGNMAPFFSFRI